MLSLVLNFILAIFLFKYLGDIVLVVWCMKKYGVPYAPTAMGMVRKMVKRLPLKRGMRVVELGSGDGRVAVEMARVYLIKVVGVELNGWLLFWSRVRAAVSVFKKGKVRFEKKDLFSVKFNNFDGVYMYLLPVMLEKLRPKLEKELKKGSLVMSYDYPIKISSKLRLKEKIEGKKPMWIYERS